MTRFTALLSASLFALSACSDSAPVNTLPKDMPATTSPAKGADLNIPFEKYTLDNGLDVILHVDKSDPVVAINLAAHVGSSRETAGRTGFAHLFEHLLFMDSENLGYGGLDEMNTRIGGDGTNGFTTHDMTQYYQAVPKDALEKVIWAEADKLGYFIKTVSQEIVDREKQVVKNEKRQRVDNRPYGHNFYIINKALYPTDHPYNWQVIGSLADLDAAGLEDVHNFYKRWYVPNNVTLTLTGDFDVKEAKALINKYFSEIPRGPNVTPLTQQASTLSEDIKLYHEDNFATVPQLTMVWPTVPAYDKDAYALDMLATYLTDGKKAPLNQVMVDEMKLTSSVSTDTYNKELSGEFYLFVNPNEGEDIDGLIPGIKAGFAKFEKDGISQTDLDRIKAGIEKDFYGDVQSALGKAIQLAEYNTLSGNPAQYKKDIAGIQAVTPDDVVRVYEKFIKGQPRLYTSFVPKGELDLTLEGSEKAKVVEEKIVEGEGSTKDFDPAARVIDNPTPSSFDRTVEPEFGKPYTLPTPDVWTETLSNGVKVFGIESNETPLVYFSLSIDAGDARETYDKPAVAELVADMLEKGTANKTTAELEDAIKALGSSISISAGTFDTTISGSALSKNFPQTIELLQEMLLQPRWDAEEFETLKRKYASNIDQSAADPNSISARQAAKLRYAEGHVFRYAYFGPKDKLETVTLDDLKSFYQSNYTQNGATLSVVGDVNKSDVNKAFSNLAKGWSREAPAPVKLAQPNAVETTQIYFYDVPGAKQSVLRLERPALDAGDDMLPIAKAINFPLGGIYTSKLNTELRVNKGYTYGIRSGFSAAKDRGSFSVRSSVRSNVTLESLELIRDIITAYGPEFTDEDLSGMQEALLRGQALDNETLSDKLSLLTDMADYGYPADYKAKGARMVEEMTLEDFQAIADEHLRPDAMRIIVVGDAATQADRLKALGYGDVIMLEKE